MRIAVLLLALGLCACSESVYLRNMAGQMVTCGPYRTGGIAAEAGAAREAQCIQDYQRQGFERVPGP